MTITISNLYISNNAPAGTIIGTFTARDASGKVIPCNYTLTKNSSGYFAISDNRLLTAWSMPIAPSAYSVNVHAVGSNSRFSGTANLSVVVLMSAAPPPPPPVPSITVNGSANPVVAEGAALTVSVANGPGNRTDWVGLAAAGAADTAFIAWVYLSGSQTLPNAGVTTATLMMTAPTTDASYEARFYVNNSYTVLTRTTFTVRGTTPPPPPPPPPVPSITVNGSTNPVVAEGAALTVSVANGPGNRTDWVGLAAVGATDTAFIAWVYLNGLQTPPNAGVTAATLMMTAPTTDASYEARFYVNNSYTVLTRTTFTVPGTTPPPPPPPPPPVPSITVNGSANPVVAEGAALTVSVANGPGNRTDWVGLAAVGAVDTAFIAWVYLNGLQTPPNAGMSAATLMMAAPTADASYEARFYVNNSYTVLTRTTFTVRGTTPPPPPQPVITVAPNSPEVPDTTSLGAVVASYTVVMSDGSPFTGTVGFGAPFFDGGGVFALSGNNIIVNPAGPGLGPNMTSITDHITLEAIL